MEEGQENGAFEPDEGIEVSKETDDNTKEQNDATDDSDKEDNSENVENTADKQDGDAKSEADAADKPDGDAKSEADAADKPDGDTKSEADTADKQDVDAESEADDNEKKPLLTEDKKEEEEEEEREYVGDRFPVVPPEVPLFSFEKCFNSSKRAVKFVFAFILLGAVFCCLLVNKGIILFVSSQMNKYVTFMKHTEPTCGTPVCLEGKDCSEKDAVRWIWAMFLCQCCPYMLMCLRCVWKICFKTKDSPSIDMIIVVSITETLHTIGVFMLLYCLLPYMDAYRSLLVMCTTATIPSILLLFNYPNTTERLGLNIGLNVAAVFIQVSALFIWFTLIQLDPIISGPSNTTSIIDVCDHFEIGTTYAGTTHFPLTSEKNNPWNALLKYVAPQLNNDTGGNNSQLMAAAASTFLPGTTEPIPTHSFGKLPEEGQFFWPLLIAPLLISVGYWENFVDEYTQMGKLGIIMNDFRKRFNKCKTKTYALTSVIKIIVAFLLLLIHTGADSSMTLSDLFDSRNFYDNRCNDLESGNFESDWLNAAVIHVSVGVLIFYSSDVSIKGRLQVWCFTVPLVIATPAAFLMLFWACETCDGAWDIKTPYFWNCYSGRKSLGDLMVDRYVYIGFLWWLSQLWIIRYLFSPKIEKLAKIDKIFTYPMFCGATIEQSLCFIRRRNDFEFQLRELQEQEQRGVEHEIPDPMADDDEPIIKKPLPVKTEGVELEVGYNPLFEYDIDGIPFIYICATMWHENLEEMLMMMTSLLGLDFDQSARRNAQEYLNIRDPDYYEFEANIFFDDAFTPYTADTVEYTGYQVNEYVELFVESVNESVRKYHKGLQQPSPKKFITPFGGRIEWTLPSGKNKLIVHLKDKMKIRNRKRWSQVMYMHYFLGQGILAQPVESERKDVVADNTYILALDGDIDFQPEAVILLLDLMKRNIKVGAACGRIHPTGNGPMVWYQMFEYSLSHWLQKATEHVLGCVLCSPGCFSLFRGSALMDDNVAGTYSKRARKPLEYVQYDQGEDRWLCTLLLQTGYRVEYSAAADAYTHAPVGFDEFFGQRRRWITSTFANLLDLLKNARYTARKNENISMVYMFYQGFLFASSVLGPATIFMLIVGAFQATFMIPQVKGFIIGLIPLTLFMILCMVGKNKHQLLAAALLSVAFAVLQMLVIVGIARQMVEDGVCSPSSVFFLFIAGSFILAGIIHPQELHTLFHGFLYFLLIPCMYLLLMIYSLCNVHVVSWGTRENKPTKTEEQLAKEQEQAAAMQQAKGAQGWKRLLSSTVWGPEDGVNSSHTFNCGSLCRAMCCVAPGSSPQDKKLNRLQRQMTVVQGQLLGIHEAVTSGDYEVYSSNGAHKRMIVVSNSGCEDSTSPDDSADNESDDFPHSTTDEESFDEVVNGDEIVEKHKKKHKKRTSKKELRKKLLEEQKKKEEEKENPKPVEKEPPPPPPEPWINNPALGNGPKTLVLPEVETNFWQDLINKYLYPLDESNVDKEKIGKGLKALRNRSVFAFFIIDLFLMVLILALNLSIAQNPDLAIKWNCTVNGEIKTSELDPIGFSFVIIFGIILGIQVVGMCIHRMFTFLQIISSTVICKGKQFVQDGRVKVEQAIKLAKEMQKIEPEDLEDDESSGGSSGYGTDHSGENGGQVKAGPSGINDGDSDVENPKSATRNVATKIAKMKTLTQHTTMGKQFAQKFLALQEEAKAASATPKLHHKPKTLRAKSLRRFDTSTTNKAKASKTLNKYGDFMADFIKDLQDEQNKKRDEQAKTIRNKYNLTQKDINNQRKKMRSVIPSEFLDPDVSLYDNTDVESNASTNNSHDALTRSASRQTLTSMIDEDSTEKRPPRFGYPNNSTPSSRNNTFGRTSFPSLFSKNSAPRRKSRLERMSTSVDENNLNLQLFEQNQKRGNSNGSITISVDEGSMGEGSI